MSTKLRIKMGAVEVEYEGSDDFLKKELPAILKAVLELHSKADDAGDSDRDSKHRSQDGGKHDRSGGSQKRSTSTIASALSAKSGTDLTIAAAAALVLGEKKDSFSRSDLLKAMQSAKSYYKTSYRSNLSNYINTLVKSQDLLDHGSDSFGLADKKRQELQKSLP